MPPDNGPRGRILDAALSVLADDGLAGFTHRRIEDRAGVSHGSTTYHFGSREKLFDAVVGHSLAKEAELLSAVMEEVLRGIADGPLGDAEGNPLLGQPFRGDFDWMSSGGIALIREYTRTLMARFLHETQLIRARFEIYLHASRTDGGLAQLTEARHRIYGAQIAQATALGYPDPVLYSRALVALVDGLAIHNIAVPDPVIEQRADDAVLLMLHALYTLPPPLLRERE